MNRTISQAKSLRGRAQVPGDKSISHRALIFGAIAEGKTRIENLLQSGDVLSTKKCLEQLGVRIKQRKDSCIVYGTGMHSFQEPASALNCENSGTSMRILMALIAAQNRKAILTGDESLSRRPMKRIAEPLRMMGANIVLTQNEFAPIEIKPRNSIALISIEYELKIASAQLKTALILAGLYADRTSKLTGKIHSRDHTERMLKAFGVDLLCTSQEIQIKPNQKLRATAIQVPGDPSSAAFWLAAGTLVSNSEIEIQNVSLNPTRTGFLKIMLRMGAQIEVCEIDMSGEPVGHLRVKSAKLKATEIFEYEIASLIDELPLLAIVASQAEGRTTIKGAKELRAKESDRIEALAINLRRMGATIDTFEDGFTIQGPQRLKGASIDSLQDHRIAMSFSVAALIADGESQICDVDSVGISYPEFYSVLDSLRKAPEKAPREPHRDCLIETTKG